MMKIRNYITLKRGGTPSKMQPASNKALCSVERSIQSNLMYLIHFERMFITPIKKEKEGERFDQLCERSMNPLSKL